jgi:hypothetical protein
MSIEPQRGWPRVSAFFFGRLLTMRHANRHTSRADVVGNGDEGVSCALSQSFFFFGRRSHGGLSFSWAMISVAPI